MKKFGFSKKDAEEDNTRSALFSGRGKSKPAASSSSNPYAQQSSSSNPYAQQDAPPTYTGGMTDSYRQEKTPVPTGGYSNFGSGDRYAGQGNYGSSAAYGQSRYESSAPAPAASRRPGGYGGLGSVEDDDGSRDQLFGGAAKRYQQREQERPAYGGGSSYGGDSNVGGGTAYGDESGTTGGYGAYGDRELTAEEQEEEDVTAAKQEIKFLKQQDVSSTRNALRLAQQAEETGRGTLQRLGEQGERIHNTEKNLDLAASQNRIAEEKARELKTLNRSMFAVHVANPFTSKSRQEQKDQQILDNHQRDRAERDATRTQAWSSTARAQEFNRAQNQAGKPGGAKGSLAERAKYQFEADSDDERMEEEIDANLDALHGAAGRLKNLSLAMNKEVSAQNQHIERIIGKTDKVDDQIAMNRARLDRIH